MADMARMQPDSIANAIKIANKQQALDAQQRKLKKKDELEILKKYEDKYGKQNLEKLAELVPSLKPLLPHITPIPTQGGMLFNIPDLAFEEATKAVAWSNWSQKTNLAASLEKEWKSNHVPIQHETSVPLAAVKPGSKCQVLGVCLCGETGKKLERFRKAVWQSIKTAFAVKVDKDKISSGSIFMKFGQPAAAVGTEGMVAMQEFWFHVGFLMWNPLALSVQSGCT
eukprot:5756959-Amphidinium_carterae.9